MSDNPNNKAYARKRIKLEPLESRTLYSADLFSASITAVGASQDTGFADSGPLSDPELANFGLISSVPTSNAIESQLEIIFIDEATPEYQLLVQDLINSSSDRTLKVITISAEQDGIQLISDTLAQHTEVSAVHLISHGSDGNVNIGKSVLNQSTLSTHENAIANWGDAFTDEGDLLIYGCNFSATENGKSLGAKIAALADIDIASSDNRTGGSDLGADWQLEQVVGTVETAIPFSAQLQDAYQRSLVNTITVDTAADVVDGDTASFDALDLDPGGDGLISLREAIIAANTQAGADTINLSSGSHSISITGNFNNPQESGDYDITSDITIQGVGSAQTIIDVTTGLTERVLEVHNGGALALHDVTISGGFDRIGAGIMNDGVLHTENVLFKDNSSQNRNGGGIYNSGSATIVNSGFENNSGNLGGAIRNTTTGTLLVENTYIDGSNSLGNNGAGLYNEGTATIRQTEISNGASNSGAGIYQAAGTTTLEYSTIKDNAGSANGGGIYILSGSVNSTGSTFTGNSGNSGGGIHQHSGTTLDLQNSTFSDNTAVFHGGGIYNDGGTATVSYSTFAFNTATTGAAVYEASGTIAIDNSIFSNSLGNLYNGVDIHAVSASNGYNIIESASVGGSAIHSTDMVGIDPLLSPLAQNGGATETHALSASSPALNSGNSAASPTTDQRGIPRDATPDIGAFEGISSDAPTVTPSLTTNTYIENTALIADGSMTISDNDSADFGGGILTITSSGYNETVDQISINTVGTDPGEIDLNGSSVLYEGTEIGTWTGGTGANALTVNLNSASSLAAVNALAQSITFGHGSENPSSTSRTLTYQVTDGDGGSSAPVDINIDIIPVNDAPIIISHTPIVVINELHYDNVGADSDESIEIAGTAGIDLNGWKIELYSTGTVYDTLSLSGIIPDEGNGFGALNFPRAPIQNGSNDAIALIDDTGTVVEFISYEGILTATAGAAVGMTSVDIGVSETNSTGLLTSVKRQDLALNSIWLPSSPNSFGLLNSSQTAPLNNSHIINEDNDLVFSAANNTAIEISDPDTLNDLQLTISVTSGLLAFSSSPSTTNSNLSFTGSLADINAELDGLTYTPNLNFNGTDTLTILIEDQDPAGSLSDTKDIEIIVNPVNDAPTGTNLTLSTEEDSFITLQSTDFGFSDSVEGDLFAAVTIVTPPVNGTLTLANALVTPGQLISISDINNGDLIFTPAADENGASYANFDFQVHDNGGIANGGVDTDTVANTITFDVSAVNDPPVSMNPNITTNEDTPHFFSVANFPFSDSENDGLSSITIRLLPSEGQLELAGVAVTQNQVIDQADISNLSFTPPLHATQTPPLDANGNQLGIFSYQITDDGGTANGGSDTETRWRVVFANINSVNDAPIGEDKTISTPEDAAYTFTDADFGFSDVIDNNAFLAVVIDSEPTNGQLVFSGSPVTAGQVIDISQIGALQFIPETDVNQLGYDSFAFSVQDDGGTAYDGVDIDPVSNTLFIDVVSVNDAPMGTDQTITLLEDMQRAFSSTDFGFTDPIDNNSLQSVILATLPGNGDLLLSGSPVTQGQVISAVNIASLVFVPDANATGASYTDFTFQVQDDGGLLNGGVDTDLTANSINFDITSVNDAPEGTNTTLSTGENTPLILNATDFGFNDLIDGDNFSAITVSPPATGTLSLASTPVNANDVISIADIINGDLAFTPALNTSGVNYTTINFQVHDDGGTTNGGVDVDPMPNLITIDVLDINNAPAGTDNTLAANEDSLIYLAPADFGFSDTTDGNTFAAVTVTTLPANGTLTLAGIPVNAAQTISINDVVGGDLVFTPFTDEYGTGYADFDFQVHDDGGTTNGGIDQDQTPNTINFNLLSTNDAPAGTNTTLSTGENTPLSLAPTDFGFTDPADGNNFAAITISAPATGSLTLAGAPVNSNDQISITDINNGDLVFTPAPNTSGVSYTTISFQVHDDGGTANGGVDIDPTPNLLTIDVLDVNNAPAGTDNTLTIDEDSAITLQSADFGFLDPIDGNFFAAITVATLPTNGTLTLANVPVTAGQLISITNINNGDLDFTPIANESGTGYADFEFQVHDDGGTSNGGIDQDQLPNKLTFDVLSINDAPQGNNTTLSILENTALTLSASNFGFSDQTDGDNFGAIVVSPPANGLLTLSGLQLIASSTVSVTQINNGDLVFTPAPNTSGDSYTAISFQVRDDGGTANGGLNTDSTPNLITIDVLSVNNAPAGSDNTLTTNEDTATTLAPADFGFSDAIDGNFFAAITVTTLPSNGMLTLASVPVTAGQLISITDINNGNFVFSPSAEQNGAGYADFDFQVHDDGGNSNGGIDQDQTANTITFNVNSTNDAPAGTDNTLTINEDTAVIIQPTDFGFSDSLDGDFFAAVTVANLPTNGTLTLANAPVTVGQLINISSINNGDLIFTPLADENGANYADFDFQVHDDGGTANGGIDQDQSPNTLTFNILSTNDAPQGTNTTLSTGENVPLTLSATDFGFSDLIDGDNFAAITVSPPVNGSLTLAGTAVNSNNVISITSISNGDLVFTPAPNTSGASYTTISFQVHDDGGTTNGGVDIDPTPNLLTIDVLDINNAPAGSDNTLTTNEDTTITLQSADFGFSDAIDTNFFAAVTVTTLPTNGTITLANVPVTAGQLISITSINNGELLFTAIADENGASYADFGFQVHDNGGSANGGIDQDQTPNKITFNVLSTNDAPQGTNTTLSTGENAPLTLSATDFGFSDLIEGDNFAAITASPPANGSLTMAGTPVNTNDVISITDINNGDLVFTPAPNTSGTSYTAISFQVHDDGGTANGGVDIDPTPNLLTIDVLDINNAPAGSDNTLVTNEDTATTLQSADFGFSDSIDANFFAAISITTLPSNGTLTLANGSVTAGQLISITNINNGELVFTPVADQNGASYADFDFQVRDDGGTTNGGIDQDQTPNTITFNVDSINDAPAGTDITLTTDEDTSITIQPADFGFSDSFDGDFFAAVTVTTLPASGTLTLANVPVTSGQTISITSIAAGDLEFTPPPGGNGTGLADFDFQVHDNGGIAKGGIDQDQTSNTISIDVSGVSDAPTGADNTITTAEDTAIVIQSADFGFLDSADSDFFAAVTVATPPSNGILTLNGATVTAGQVISITNISNGDLMFTPSPDQSGPAYSSFTFLVHDTGSTNNGGVVISQTPATIIIDVLAVNDAPVGVGSTQLLTDQQIRILSPSDFSLIDTENHTLQSVVLNAVPANGTLTLNGTPLSPGDTLTYSDLTTNSVTYTPPQNITTQDFIDFTVTDNGGTSNGGSDTAVAPARNIINVVPVNDPPTATDNTLFIDEDNSYSFDRADFGFSDPLDSNEFSELLVNTTSGAGLLSVNGTPITSPANVSVADIDNGLLTFTPDADANGNGYATIEFKVRDDGGTTYGGQDTSQNNNTITLNINPVNDAPQGTDTIQTLLEDQSYTLSLADIGYSDPAENHPLNSVTVTTAPVTGQLLLTGTLIAAGDSIPVAALNNGDVVFVPAIGSSGSPYDSFSFQVQDTGGTLNNGIDVDQSPATMTFNVTPVSDAPEGADKLLSINEDATYTFALPDFGFSDPLDTPPDQFRSVEITQLPITGTLSNNGSAVAAGTNLSAADILSGNLIYTPNANNYGQGFDNFLFRVIDSGNTVNGGENQDQSDNKILFDIASVSDAPVGTDSNITINEDSTYSLQVSDFGFSDINDGDYFSAITVMDVPANGTLTLNGSAVAANQIISITDINNGDLIFSPAQDDNGSNYADFTFLIHDTGTTANGGQNISQNYNTTLFNVVSINDAPSGQNSGTQVVDNSSYQLGASDFPFTDLDNHALQSIRIDSLPLSGMLTLNGNAVSTGSIISASDLNTGALIYQPALNLATQDVIDFSVIDNGGTDNGGNNTQAIPAQLTFTTLIVNDAPIAADSTLVINEDSPIILDVTDFNFADPAEQNEFVELIITSVSGNGTLSLGGAPITSIAAVPVADINASQLVFTPDSNTSGAAYATVEFKVKDDGGIANGGQDTSQSHTLTIDVNQINDAPTATSSTINLSESTAQLFSAADFGFSDPLDGHSFLSIIFTQLPIAGTLTLNGAAVQADQLVSIVEIDSDNLIYQPAQGQWGQSFDSLQFKVQDNGGTENGGENTSVQSEMITFNVAELNTAPSGSDSNIAITEHNTHILSASDFGFSDSQDNHNFRSVNITSLSNNGLTYNGLPVFVGDEIQVSDIEAGLLTYTAPLNDNLQQIAFQVTDNGNPQNGPTTDLTENLITFDLTLVNDPPELINEGAIYAEGSDNTISTTVLAAIDPDDPAQDLAFTLQSIPENGQLAVNGTALSPGDFFTMQQLNNSEIHYIHDGSETSNDFFDFTLADGGEDGVVPITARFNIDVTEVVDPITPLQDNSLTLTSGDNFDTALGDVLSTGEASLFDGSLLGSGLFEIEIIDQPDHGTVTLNPNGTFLYKHDGSNSATDFFVYRVTNDDGASATARVNIVAEPKLDTAIEAPLENELPFVAVPISNTFSSTQLEPEPSLEVEQLVASEPEGIETSEATTETAASSDSEALDAEQQTDQLTSLSTEESLFSVSAIPATSSFANQPGALRNVTYTDYDFEIGASIIERDLLRSLNVRQHNEINAIYLFEDYENTTISVSSVDLRFDLPTSFSEAANNKDFLRGLSRAQGDLESAENQSQRRFEVGGDVAISVSISTTAGILAWLLRGGALFGSLMAATPLWSSIDPLRVTGAKAPDEETDKSEVEEIFK